MPQDAAPQAGGMADAAPPAPAAATMEGSEAGSQGSKGGKGGEALGVFGGGMAGELLQREASGPSPHYDPSREIVLRYEFLSSRAIKVRQLAAVRSLACGGGESSRRCRQGAASPPSPAAGHSHAAPLAGARRWLCWRCGLL